MNNNKQIIHNRGGGNLKAANRIEYIDAMRGLAMLFVVVCHVMNHWEGGDNLFRNLLNVQFQIPLFFLVSGFFVSKTKLSSVKDILSKFTLLVIPANIMGVLCCIIRERSIVNDLVFSHFHAGYWFTFALFEFIVIFEVIRHICRRIHLQLRWELCIQSIISIIFIYIASFSEKYEEQFTIINLFTIGELFSYIYFVLGYIISVYYKQVLEFLTNKKIVGVLIALTLLSNLIEFRYGINAGVFTRLSIILITTLGLFVIWKLFLTFPELSSSSKTGRFLSFVGQRTLDVYFIHYFILPYNLTFIKNFFRQYPSPLIEYLLAVILGIIFTLISLGIGQIIRLSPYTAKWMLGVKSKTV